MKKRGVIIFDLDNTLFDTDALKRDFFRVLKKYGISKDEALRVATTRFSTQAFIPKKYTEELFSSKVTRTQVLKDFLSLLKKSEGYWYCDAYAFLSELKKRHTLVLLTYGNTEYQQSKVLGTRFEKLFDSIVVTGRKDKALDLKRIKQAFSTFSPVLLDDSHAALASAKKLGIAGIQIKKTKKDAAYFEKIKEKLIVYTQTYERRLLSSGGQGTYKKQRREVFAA